MHDRAAARGGGVPSLSVTERAACQSFLEATRVLLDTLERRLQADADIPLAYYDILVALSEAPDRTLRMGDLAHRLRSSASRLSHAITRLEDHHWVRRESAPSDRRGAVAVLTEEGSNALADMVPGYVAAVRRHLIDPLTPAQLAQLTEISRAVSDANPAPQTPRRRREDRQAVPHPREPAPGTA